MLLLSPEPLPLLSVVYPMSVPTAFGVGCFGVLLLLLLLLMRRAAATNCLLTGGKVEVKPQICGRA